MKGFASAVIIAAVIGGVVGFGLHAGLTGKPVLVLSDASPPAETPPPKPDTSPQKPTAAPAKNDEASAFSFQRIIINSSGNAAEACLRFNRPLDDRAEAHYGDYLRIDPKISPAIRTNDADLCLAGLDYGTSYHVTLLKGLADRTGETLAQDVTSEVSLADRPALVALSGGGFILPRDIANGLTVQSVNVDRLKIRVLRMSDRLLPHTLGTGGFGRMVDLSAEKMERYEIRSLLQGAASVIWTGTMDVARDHNRTVETAFPLASIIKADQPGAYLVIAENATTATPDRFFAKPQETKGFQTGRFEDNEDFFSQIPAHWVISTHIALTAMSGEDGLHVFARSLATAKPLADIKLSLVATGEDVLGAAATDRDGRVDFGAGLMRGAGAEAPATITAYGPDGDFTVLKLTRPAFDLSDRGVSGRPQPGAIEAFLYTERGIYRPGETVQLMALLRDHLGHAADKLPATLILRRPDGVEAKRFSLPAQPQGGMHQPITLSASAAQGMWSVDLLTDPSGNPVGRVQFDVEDFVPQKLKIDLKAAGKTLTPGQPVDVTVNGRFLYGAPAAELKGEAELRVTRDPAPVTSAKDYQFGLIDEKTEDSVQLLDMPAADASGQAHIASVLEPPKQSSAPLKAIISAGLFEPGERLVKSEIEVPIHAQQILIGIKPRFAENRVDVDKPADFDIRVFDGSGNPIARPGLAWRLVREERNYDWFNLNKGWSWHYHVEDQPIASGSLDVTEGRPATLTQRHDWGTYRLIVEDPATQAASSVRFESGWGEITQSDETPDKVRITAEKSSLTAGESTRLRIEAPFAGEAQISIAADRVFQTKSFSIPKEGATIEVKADAEWGAGAYVLVSMMRPLNTGRPHDPVRAVGVAWLGIDASARTLSVAMDAPEKLTPRQKLALPVTINGLHGGGQTFITIAAIDEGILQLTHYAAPDPAEFLFGKRRLGVELRDDYGRLLDGSADPGAIHEGGDEGIGGPGLPVTSTRTVALFSGPVTVDAEGHATVLIDIPDFEGQLRLMAVAYNHDAVGKGEKDLIVRDPVVAELFLPRFMAPGDHAQAALSLHDTDGPAGAYHLSLATSGPVQLDKTGRDYTLASGARQSDSIALTASDEGIATIRLDLTGPRQYHVHREWQMAVRGAHYPLTLTQTTAQQPGETFRIDAKLLDPFVPGSVTANLGYSNTGGIDVTGLLQSLYRYPFGCTEQLVSTAFPLLYESDPALLGKVARDTSVRDRVQRTIDTILDRQDPQGRFGLWRVSDGEASAWLNVYALDFLAHAAEAGFSVPDAPLQRGYAWLRERLRNLDHANAGVYAHAPDATRAYGEYVLARAGRADLGELRRLHDAIVADELSGKIAASSVYWSSERDDDHLAEPLSLGQIAGALALMGDHPRAEDTFQLAIANLGVVTYPRWWFDAAYYTPTRDLAGLVSIAAETGNTALAAALLDRLNSQPLSSADLNTQEKAWLLAAAHALNKDDPARKLSVNSVALPQLKLPLALAPGLAEIAAGYSVKNDSPNPIWRSFTLYGSPRTAPPTLAKGYTLAKEYFHLDGSPADPAHLHQNDRIIVSLKGSSDDDGDHRSVLVDLLPAGWEIEGPVVATPTPSHDPGAGIRRRLSFAVPATSEERTDQRLYGFLGPLSALRVSEARDDRYVATFDLGDGLVGEQHFRAVNDDDAHLAPQEFHVAYIARVVTLGSFSLPEAVVEDMYRPGIMARTAAATTSADAAAAK